MTRPKVSKGATPITRRSALGVFAGGAATLAGAGALSACSGPEKPSDKPTSGGGSAKGTVRVWMVPGSPEDQKFQRAQFDLIEKNNPGLTVESQFFAPDQFASALQLAFTGGEDAPDVIKSHGAEQIGSAQIAPKDWIQPLDDFMDDDFKSRFPDYVWEKTIDGKKWGIPFPDPAMYSTRLQYTNLDVIAKFGFDAPPATWSELSEMANKISKDGDREVYGAALTGAIIGPCVAIIQNLAGPQPYKPDQDPPISLLTGEAAMSEPSLVDTIDFFRQLNADGALSPGWESWTADAIIEQMAGGRLATYTFPIFHVAALRAASPDLNLALTVPPTPDEGQLGTRAIADETIDTYMMTSQADPDKAWVVLDHLGSLEYEAAAFTETGALGIMPELFEEVEVDDDSAAIREIAEATCRVHPVPGDRNPDAGAAYGEIAGNPPTPLPFELYMKSITKNEPFADLAADYDEKLAGVMEEQFKKAGVTKEDFAFPDWDPMTDYEM